MKRTVYVLGNPIVPLDSLGPTLIPLLIKHLPDWNIVHHDPTDEFSPLDTHVICIDTVVGLQTVRVFSDLEDFSAFRTTSVHDYDLITELSILLKLGKVTKTTIIGIPQTPRPETLLDPIIAVLQSI